MAPIYHSGLRRDSSSNASGSSARSNRSGTNQQARTSVASASGNQESNQRHFVKAQITNIPVIELEVVDSKA